MQETYECDIEICRINILGSQIHTCTKIIIQIVILNIIMIYNQYTRILNYKLSSCKLDSLRLCYIHLDI